MADAVETWMWSWIKPLNLAWNSSWIPFSLMNDSDWHFEHWFVMCIDMEYDMIMVKIHQLTSILLWLSTISIIPKYPIRIHRIDVYWFVWNTIWLFNIAIENPVNKWRVILTESNFSQNRNLRQVSVTSTSQTEYTAAGLTAGLSYRFQVKDGWWVGMGRLKESWQTPQEFFVTVSGQVMVGDGW